MRDLEKSVYAKKAMALFKEGYNCSQAVTLAFADKYSVDTDLIAKLTSSFGGGIGGLREVCGAVSGMSAVTGMIFGFSSPKGNEAKKEHYKLIQEMAEKFRKETGSIVCRELLGLDKKDEPKEPELRTAEYNKKRPCNEMVGLAAAIIEEYIDK